MSNLVWNVYKEDINKREIEIYNIFNHKRFKEDCVEIFTYYRSEDNYNYDKMKRDIEALLQYYFWSKCEYEIILSDWPPNKNFKEKKIDIYDQVMLNIDAFISSALTQYLWSY